MKLVKPFLMGNASLTGEPLRDQAIRITINRMLDLMDAPKPAEPVEETPEDANLLRQPFDIQSDPVGPMPLFIDEDDEDEPALDLAGDPIEALEAVMRTKAEAVTRIILDNHRLIADAQGRTAESIEAALAEVEDAVRTMRRGLAGLLVAKKLANKIAA